jgi:hypothetical protein
MCALCASNNSKVQFSRPDTKKKEKPTLLHFTAAATTNNATPAIK